MHKPKPKPCPRFKTQHPFRTTRPIAFRVLAALGEVAIKTHFR